jgi:hypothetical protein
MTKRLSEQLHPLGLDIPGNMFSLFKVLQDIQCDFKFKTEKNGTYSFILRNNEVLFSFIFDEKGNFSHFSSEIL